MRKRLVLLCAALTVCAVAIYCAVGTERTIPVSTITLTAQAVEKTVSCDGVIEAGEKIPIFAEMACCIDRVVVQKGMYVQQGDVIAYIDKTATKASGRVSPGDALTLSAMSEEIRAPRSGIILKLELTDGAWVERTDVCAVIAPSDSVRVRVAIRERHLPLLRSGLATMVSGDALRNESYTGTLTEISSTAQSLDGGGTIVEGIVEFDDSHADPSLRIGVNVKAKIIVETVTDGVVIPYDAVSDNDQSQSFVYILSDGEAVKHILNDDDQLSNGLLVKDEALVGKTIIANAKEVASDQKVRYTALEEKE